MNKLLNTSPLYKPQSKYRTAATTDKGKQIMEGLLLRQYQSSPDLKEFIMAFVSELDLLFEQIEEVYLGRFIENAVGKQLDIIGIILQQPRSVILPTQWFGFSNAGTVPANVAGMANESSPANGGIFRDENVGGGEVTPLDDNTYRKMLLAKAVITNRDAADLSLAYFVVSILLGRVPSLFELRDADSVHANAVENGEFTDGIDSWVEGTIGTGAVLETNVGWSPNYKDDGYVTIPAWEGQVGDTIELSFTCGRTHTLNQMLFDGQDPRSYLYINEGDNEVQWESTQFSVTRDGVPFTRGTPITIGEQVNLELTLLEPAYITKLGARYDNTSKLFGKIWDVKLNSFADQRYYKSNLQSDPSGDYLTLVDENGFKIDEWLPNFKGDGYISIPEISLPVTSTISAEFIWDGSGVGERRALFCSVVGSYQFIISDATNLFNWHGITNVMLNGESVGSGTVVAVAGKKYHLECEITNDMAFSTIGSLASGYDKWRGSITNFMFNDTTNPANSRFYPNVVISADQPQTTVLEDTEYDEATAPFYLPDTSASNSRIDIPVWVGNAGDVIEFKFRAHSAPTAGGEYFIDSDDVSARSVIGYSTNGRNWTVSNLAGTVYLDGVEISNETLFSTDGSEHTVRAVLTGTEKVAKIGNSYNNSYSCNMPIWDVKLTDNTDPTNSRYYPSLEYRADGNASGTVLEATEGSLITKDFSDGQWSARRQGTIVENRLIVSNTTTIAEQAEIFPRPMPNNVDVVVSFDVVSFSGPDARVYVYREGAGDSSQFFGAAHVGTRQTLTFSGISDYGQDSKVSFYSTQVGQSYEVANIEITQSMDGELISFPVGSEWTSAALPNLTQGDMVDFIYPTWIQAPSTDGTLERFTSPVWDRLEGDGHLKVTPPNGENGYAEQVLEPLVVRANENYDFSVDFNNEDLSGCRILVGTETDVDRYYTSSGQSGSGTAIANFTPDLDEPVYVRLGSIEQNTWSTFDNASVTNTSSISKRAVELLLSAKDASPTEVQLISYMSKYFVPAGTTFNIRTI